LKNTLNALIEIQEIDMKLDVLNDERGDLPEIVKQLQEKIRTGETSQNLLETRINEIKLEEKQIELDVEISKGHLKKYEEQLYKVKTNKEYDAIANETETAKNKINEYENRLMEIADTIEKTQKDLTDLKITILQNKKELVENTEDLNAKISESSEEEKILLQERQIVIDYITKQQLSTYERIRKAKKGTAVVYCNGGICSGCFSFIPPQKVVEIKNMKRIYTCESCGRILVYNTNEE